MSGFFIRRCNLEQTQVNHEITIGQFGFEINAENCIEFKLKDGGYIILDGYFWPQDNEKLINIITTKQFSLLDEFEGHYSGVWISKSEIIIFNDRFGGKTVYFQNSEQSLLLASRPYLMPTLDTTISKEAAHESFLFRWTTADQTLCQSIKKLRARSYGNITADNEVQQHCYWQLGPAKYNADNFTSKQQKVKEALQNHLIEASKKYKKVAIFLSGGVDSSLLAALSKPIFEECFLITPVFKNQANPELETAQTFAQQLGLPLHLVEIEPDSLAEDLTALINLKREPLRHYSSLAMLAMLKAIPQEFEAVIYGEAADTLFGSNSIKRITTQYRWKQQTRFVPLWALKLFKKLIPGRGKVFVDLKSTSLQDLIYSLTAIQYTPKSAQLIQQIDPGRDTLFEAKPWQKDLAQSLSTNLRHVAQQYIITSSIQKHFEEAELIAEQYDKHIISPFFAPEVIELANTLNDKDYFGDDFVKPVLREIACEYFSRELIYQRKYGFPVPFIDWLNNSLANLVVDVKNERELFDGQLLADLSVEQDYEVFWLLINWKIFHQQLTIENS